MLEKIKSSLYFLFIVIFVICALVSSVFIYIFLFTVDFIVFLFKRNEHNKR